MPIQKEDEKAKTVLTGTVLYYALTGKSLRQIRKEFKGEMSGYQMREIYIRAQLIKAILGDNTQKTVEGVKGVIDNGGSLQIAIVYRIEHWLESLSKKNLEILVDKILSFIFDIPYDMLPLIVQQMNLKRDGKPFETTLSIEEQVLPRGGRPGNGSNHS